MKEFRIGLYGLGVMGSSLAKNLIHHGFQTALYGKGTEERSRFFCEENVGNWQVFENMTEFVGSLSKPRTVFLMITAGKPVDMVISSLLPYLETGDVLIDGGNSHFQDTNRRASMLAEKGIYYLGIGVSGGEKGALTGPSMMVGGSYEGWLRCKDVLQSVAADYNGESCCGYVGPEGAGHYVKMVHNGIEYAILQLIADSYQILKEMNLPHEQIFSVFDHWHTGVLNGYLMDISVRVLGKTDSETGRPLVDCILDVAGQNGTGSWTLIEAVARGVYTPTISEAVFARNFSQQTELRKLGSNVLARGNRTIHLENYEERLESALYAGIICCYAQGLELIKKASYDFEWNIDLRQVVSLWRDGCIIRSKFLSLLADALDEEPDAPNILLTKRLSSLIATLQSPWREVIVQAIMGSTAVPALISTISYYESYHTEKMSINLVQGLRDCFGAHTYERVDKPGRFHTVWEEL